MGLRALEVDGGMSPLRRALALVRGSVADLVAPNSVGSRITMGAIVYVAAVPFAGWAAPSLWFALVVGLILTQWAWARRPSARPGEIDPFHWLLSLAYALAAFYLVFEFDRAAQTLGVTMFGIIRFQVLARDYAAPRRLVANLLAPVTLMLIVQAG